MRQTTRRAVLAGGLACTLPIAALADTRNSANLPNFPPALSADPDAALRRLGEDYDAALARFDAVLSELGDREARAMAAYPPQPADPPVPREVNEIDFSTWTLAEIGSDKNPIAAWSRAGQRRQEEWVAEKERIDARFGVPEAHQAELEAGVAVSAIMTRIIETPATTLAGLLVKRRVAKLEGTDRILDSIADDLDAMAAAQAAVG